MAMVPVDAITAMRRRRRGCISAGIGDRRPRGITTIAATTIAATMDAGRTGTTVIAVTTPARRVIVMMTMTADGIGTAVAGAKP